MTQLLTTSAIGHYHSPIGLLEVRGSEKGIYSISFVENENTQAEVSDFLQDAMDRLHAYFQGRRQAFAGMKLALHGADFPQSVWSALLEIPYGETVTYGDIAERIQNPNAVRAVGTAVGNNPLAIVVPCHRVLPANGGVGNYNAGSWRKEWLLNHES